MYPARTRPTGVRSLIAIGAGTGRRKSCWSGREFGSFGFGSMRSKGNCRSVSEGSIALPLGRRATARSHGEPIREHAENSDGANALIDGRYVSISLFSGAMGLDLGLHKTGRFHFAVCVEKEPVYCQTIRANIDAGNLPADIKVYESDIRDLDPSAILREVGLKPGQVDLLVGGPPCQSFSTAGKRGTVQDARGTLLWEFLRFVRAIKPRAFLMENVRGLMSAAVRHRPITGRPDKGGLPFAPDEEPGSVFRLFAEDLSSMDEARYRLDVFEVNAVNYGAPQLRERVLFVGNRYNAEVDMPDPTHGPGAPSEPQHGLFESNALVLRPWRTLRDAIGDLHETDPVLMDFSPRKKHYLTLVPPGGNWRHLPERIQRESLGKAYLAKGGRSGWWRRLSYDLPCPTLVTMPNHASTALCHPEEVRALTIREYCRIQEFPDRWIVCGTPAHQYAQIGNAVPVRLGEVAGTAIGAMLDNLAAKGWRISSGPMKPYRRIYIQSHVRTRQWFRKGEAFKWDDGADNGHAAYRRASTIRCTTVVAGKV
jgi:DNA (cytosine-5)-methyltransferase 1